VGDPDRRIVGRRRQTTAQRVLDEICSRAEARARELLHQRTAAHGPGLGESPAIGAGLSGDVRIGWRERWLGQSSQVM
jgi:hypothetical protein